MVLKDKTPRRSIIGIKGYVWSSEELESPRDPNRVSSPKKRKLRKMSAVDLEDETAIKRVKSCRAGKGSILCSDETLLMFIYLHTLNCNVTLS